MHLYTILLCLVLNTTNALCTAILMVCMLSMHVANKIGKGKLYSNLGNCSGSTSIVYYQGSWYRVNYIYRHIVSKLCSGPELST